MVPYLMFARENKGHNVKFLLFSHLYFIFVRCVFRRVCANLFCGLTFLAFPLYKLDFCCIILFMLVNKVNALDGQKFYIGQLP